MKAILLHSLAIAALLLAGCATVFRPWLLSEVHEGMTRDQVVEILGNPDSTEVKNGVEYLHYVYEERYPSPASRYPAFDDGDWLLQERQIEQGLKRYRFAVKIVDGKLESYRELD